MKTITKFALVIVLMATTQILRAQSIVGPATLCIRPGETKTVELTISNPASYDCIIVWEEGTETVVSGVPTFNVTKTFFPAGGSLEYPQCSKTFVALPVNYTGPALGSPAIVRKFRIRYLPTGSSTATYSGVYTLTINGEYGAGTISTSTTQFLNTASGTITVAGNDGPVTWHYSGSEGSGDQGTGVFSGVTSTRTYNTYRANSGCSVTESNKIMIEVFKAGAITGTSTVTEGDWVTLQNTTAYKNLLQWEYSTDGGTTWTVVVTNSSTYRHQVVKTSKFRTLVDLGPFGTGYSGVFTITANTYLGAQADPTNGANYVRQQQVTAAGITDPASVNGLGVTQKHEVFTYQDAFGRPVQQNITKANPSAQNDVVQISSYDGFGRRGIQYLDYVSPLNFGAYRASALSEQLAYYANGSSDKVADSPDPYAVTVFEKSPLQRVTEVGSVGSSWQPGGGHSNLITYSSNVANEVWMFNGIGGAATFYGANELLKIETTDADQKKSQKFTDKTGRTILTRVQLDEKVNGGSTATPWLETYYVYNELGQLKYILPPNGRVALKSASTVLSQAIIDKHAYQFIYDAKGRLVEKKVPGQGWTYFCYDRLDRLVLMQDANTGTNKWIYIKYDRQGRPVMQGIYTNTTPHTTRAALQQNVLDPLYPLDTDLYYEEKGNAAHGYTNQAFPTTNTQPLTVNYFDNYDFDFNGSNDYAYVAQGLANENTPATNFRGLATGSRRLVLDGGSTWLFTYMFYDADGRVIQVRSNNHLNPAAVAADQDLETIVYDFEGKTTIRKNYHNAGSGNVTTVINKFTYDHMGRITQVRQNNNAASSDQLVAQYEYNEIGQLVDKKLHNTSGNNFLQSVDMRYSIQGWLSSINNAQLGNDSGVTNDETNDYFGMELLYEKTETGLTSSTDVLYNGNVSAIKWKGIGSASGEQDQMSYKFQYDKANRIRSGTSQRHTGTAWTKETNAFNESTSVTAGVSGYDYDGNIRNLQRNQRKHQLTGTVASYTSEAIDNLTYAYATTSGTPLLKITDASANVAGFDNGTSSTGNDYTYNLNGDLTSDANKGISSITYNHLGKTTLIDFGTKGKVEYVYDAAGNKLTRRTYGQGVVLQSTLDYVNGFVYEAIQTNPRSLSFFSSPEGRVVNKAGTLEYQYSIKDNQGNTRVVFSSLNTSDTHLATFEDPVADGQVFKNVSTSTTYWVTKAGANNSGTKVIRMNGTYNPSGSAPGIGPAKSINVFPGDAIDLEVWAYYEGSSAFGGSSLSTTTLINSVATIFTAGVPAGEAAKISAGIGSAYGTFGSPGNLGDSRPSAFLNYILFDKDYKLLDMGWKEIPTTANMTKQKLSFPSMNIKAAGYMYVYLSYEGQGTNWVYFDDLEITHTKSNVIQYNEYYPFGLQANTSWTRDENTGNNYLYNAGNELNLTTGWYETFFRNYDPITGRFTAIDPSAAKYGPVSAYNYAFNNPMMFNDPTGADNGQYLPDWWGFVGGYMDNEGVFHWYDPDGLGYTYASLGMGAIYNDRQRTANYLAQVQAHSASMKPYGTYLSINGREVPGTRKVDGYSAATKPSARVVIFGGADLAYQGLSDTMRKILSDVNSPNVSQKDGVNVIYTDSDDKFVKKWAKELAESYKKGQKIILYGYSKGGDLALRISRELNGMNVPVDGLITVDVADGPFSGSLDRYVPFNVKINYNFYQTTPGDIIPSYGGPNMGPGQIQNANMTAPYINHGNMDERTMEYATFLLNYLSN